MRDYAERHPVVAYVVLCYAITWSVWFAIPLVSDGEWTAIKIFIGVGMGPGLAAVLLDRLRGTAGRIDGRWWKYFILVAVPVALLNLSSVLTGDAARAPEFVEAAPLPLCFTAFLGVLLTSIVSGVIFASAAVSRTRWLGSIADWRTRRGWTLFALLFPPALMLLAIALAALTGDEVTAPRPAGLTSAAWLGFIGRSFLFSLLVVGIGEETGWRGWMLPQLLRRFSPLLSSIVVGVVWGFWHLPLYIIGAYDGHPSQVVELLFMGPLLATLYTWLWLRSGGKLLPAIILHATSNNVARMLPNAAPFSGLLLAFIIGAVAIDRLWRRRSGPEVQ